jgi:hypothetical protein
VVSNYDEANPGVVVQRRLQARRAAPRCSWPRAYGHPAGPPGQVPDAQAMHVRPRRQ